MKMFLAHNLTHLHLLQACIPISKLSIYSCTNRYETKNITTQKLTFKFVQIHEKSMTFITSCTIAIYATSCKMSVFFALDMTTCRVQKNSHFATSFIKDFFLI
jgi:hypothetical protein